MHCPSGLWMCNDDEEGMGWGVGRAMREEILFGNSDHDHERRIQRRTTQSKYFNRNYALVGCGDCPPHPRGAAWSRVAGKRVGGGSPEWVVCLRLGVHESWRASHELRDISLDDVVHILDLSMKKRGRERERGLRNGQGELGETR